MPRAYRIVRPEFADTAFDGEGARLFGGRWNEKGTRMVYTSASPSLAAMESFVHMGIEAKSIRHIIIEIDIPDDIVKVCDKSDLPDEWNKNPAPEVCQEFGTAWADSKESVVLSIPSIVIEMERNYLINPAHPDSSQITIVQKTAFSYDERMWKMG